MMRSACVTGATAQTRAPLCSRRASGTARAAEADAKCAHCLSDVRRPRPYRRLRLVQRRAVQEDAVRVLLGAEESAAELVPQRRECSVPPTSKIELKISGSRDQIENIMYKICKYSATAKSLQVRIFILV